MRRRIYAISRAKRFSPNSVDKDAAILEGVACELRQAGFDVEIRSEGDIPLTTEAAAYISMGREPATVATLKRIENAGVPVINSARSVETCCNRRRVNDMMRRAGVRLPDTEGNCGYWLKRADGTAESSGDIRFAADRQTAERELMLMKSAGINDIIVQAHVRGDLVKFYGVSGTDFFHLCYPCDDGNWKFEDERRNGTTCHYLFDKQELHDMAERAAETTETTVYGGDCIVDSNGRVTIIDFNDWPSFSRCREKAATAIAETVTKRVRLYEIKNTSNDR
ncbi:MAG: hypothetical protein J6B91_03115 [Prevotella sp.]|nr:hypothetical protein [Prevotella sp.]